MTTGLPVTRPPALSRRRVLVIIGALMLGVILASLDQTVVATALPTIAGDLHDLSHLSWVVTAYILASTVSTPLWGKLGDMYGRKIFFQAAIVIFLADSALSGLSTSMPELIAFRAVQGLGGGGLMIGAQATVGDVIAPRDRGRYQGLFGAVFGVTSVIGPLIGGFFVTNLSWRSTSTSTSSCQSWPIPSAPHCAAACPATTTPPRHPPAPVPQHRGHHRERPRPDHHPAQPAHLLAGPASGQPARNDHRALVARTHPSLPVRLTTLGANSLSENRR